MKRCPSRIPIDDMWRRFTSVLSYPVSSSSKRKRYVSLTDFFLSEVSSSKCIHSAYYLMPSTKKLTFQKVPPFKRILFVYLKMWKNPTLDLHLQPAQFGICWQSHEQKRGTLRGTYLSMYWGRYQKYYLQWYLCYFLLYKYALFYHHCLPGSHFLLKRTWTW